jgi:hypothetical protein
MGRVHATAGIWSDAEAKEARVKAVRLRRRAVFGCIEAP